MKFFKRPEAEASVAADEPAESSDAIAGDRGIPQIDRARSVQSRLSSFLAFGLMCALGLGFLTWYYARALARPAQAHQAAQAAARTHAQGEMDLPSIGRVSVPVMQKAAPPAPAPVAPEALPSAAMERALGPAPPVPVPGMTAVAMPMGTPYATPPEVPQKSAGEVAFERRLAGPAFSRSASDGAAPPAAAVSMGSGSPGSVAGPEPIDPLQALLKPTLTPAVAPSLLPTRRFLLAKGAFIDCTLETAIDSTLPGMTTCITATDTFGADGSIVLVERGTKLVGETRGQVAQGTSRIFVLWTEARTPTGVVVPLSSPGTDELGRSGLTGTVDNHFWDRFGAAILMTVVNGAVQGAVNSRSNGGSVVISPTTSTDIMTEILRNTIAIPPTVTKDQGDRIQVFVARDVDFRSVYALRVASMSAQAAAQ
ncbi:MAG: type IV secretion system protein VirB10 [Proteobacteria bacterium]|nr:type IV secretion system protein VirB10 [Pseudomonadota bacterium]